MKKLISILTFVALSISVVQAQENTLKKQALDEFKKEHYNEAISLLEKAIKESPNAPEIYYYLGWFNHYRAYDSRPLKGYNYAYSERIFEYLDKAIELNPNYGDAKYFYSAECGSLAIAEMENYNAEKVKYFYERAFKKGTFPKWLIEYGRNYMSTCDKDAILFAGGDADFNICSYLQICENFRTDITVIPIGFIDRPWYVNFLKNGLKNTVRKINIDLTEKQIMDIRPFKWRETSILIDISPADRLKFGLPENFKMEWAVAPDLQSYRMHSKIEGEEVTRRTLLSPQRAILLQIVEDNFAERPIYFSNFIEPTLYGGLNFYFQDCGLTSRLIPVESKNIADSCDISKLETFLKPENIKSFSTLKTEDMPRISGVTKYGYNRSFIMLAQKYKETNQHEKLAKLIDIYKSTCAIGLDKEYGDEVLKVMTE